MNDLHALMDRALADLDVPTDRLHEGAVRRGRAERRRRRLRSGLVTTAAVVAVAALGVALLPGDSTARHAVATGRDVDSQSGSVVGWWDMPADQMLDVLQRHLPAGAAVTAHQLAPPDRAPGEPAVSHGWVRATVESGRGTGDVEVILYSPDALGPADQAELDDQGTVYADSPSRRERLTCPGNLTQVDYCRELVDAQGKLYGRLATTVTGDLVVREVTMRVWDGLVHIATANSTAPKWGVGTPVSSETPPLSLAELEALAAASWNLLGPSD
jgi:hypothetical protein